MSNSSIWTIGRTYHSGQELTKDRWQWRDTLHFPKLQHYLRSSPSDCLMLHQDTCWESLTPLQRRSWCILQPQSAGQVTISRKTFLWNCFFGSKVDMCKCIYLRFTKCFPTQSVDLNTQWKCLLMTGKPRPRKNRLPMVGHWTEASGLASVLDLFGV